MKAIHFCFISEDEAISLLRNVDLSEKGGTI